MANMITIEVAFALPHKQSLLSLEVLEGTRVETAIEKSGILNLYPEIDLQTNKIGIWSKNCKLNQVLTAGDRIEIYRPLIADPKEVRKRRAEKAVAEGRADKVTGGRPNPRKKTES